MYVAYADSMYGPWTTQRVRITGMGNLHISNPSIALLTSNHTMLAYRFNTGSGEQNGFALSESFLGPFESVTNLSKAPGNDEDPFLWQEPSDDSLHILYHNGPHGLHAFSQDGIVWQKSPIGSHAFGLSFNLTDNSTFSLRRRERPEILFDADGRPLYLYNGVNTGDATLPGTMTGEQRVQAGEFGRAFSLIQPFVRL